MGSAFGASIGGATYNYILVRDEKAQGTDGGTFTSGADRTRDINTEVTDTGGDCTVSSNQITLTAGTYRCRIIAPAIFVNAHRAWLYNVTDSTTQLLGSSSYSNSTAGSEPSVIIGRFAITSTKVFEIRHRCTATKATNGYGVNSNLAGTEVYTIAEFWKETTVLGAGSTSPGFVSHGRLTLTTATPVTTSDVTGATTIYYAPCPWLGNKIFVPNGTYLQVYSFNELSLAIGTLTSGKNYDVFVYSNSGTLTLKLGTAWTSDTARVSGSAGELTTIEGVYTNKYTEGGMTANTGLYVGTIRTTSTTATEDSYGGASQSGGKRFVWNMYNRVKKNITVIDTTDSWAYTTATWRAANGASGNKVEYICGYSMDLVEASSYCKFTSSLGVNAANGVGVDSTSTNSAKITQGIAGTSNNGATGIGIYNGYPGLGYHYLQWLEISQANGTTTWYGDAGLTSSQSGMNAIVMG